MGRKARPIEQTQKDFCLDGCVTCTKDPLFVVEDGDKSIVFENTGRDEICKIRIDDCVVKLGLRADWIVSQDSVGHLIIEFKGHDLDKAFKQIMATAQMWNANFRRPNEQMAALIICNRVPKAPSSTSLQLKYLRAHRGQLAVKSHKAGMKCSLVSLVRTEPKIKRRAPNLESKKAPLG